MVNYKVKSKFLEELKANIYHLLFWCIDKDGGKLVKVTLKKMKMMTMILLQCQRRIIMKVRNISWDFINFIQVNIHRLQFFMFK
jgi:hypothetical protein